LINSEAVSTFRGRGDQAIPLKTLFANESLAADESPEVFDERSFRTDLLSCEATRTIT
jgi:hypothetical protein